MNILWITNIMLPPICNAIGADIPPIGGWMYSSLKRLIRQHIGRISVATVYPGSDFIEHECDGVTYFLLPLNGKSITNYNSCLETLWRSVKNKIQPDVIHIHGSEYPHGLAYVKACGSTGVVVSLQGIISGYARYYPAGIPINKVKSWVTLRDFIKRDSILRQQQDFERRAKLETELLSLVNNVIGRTEWDYAHSKAINADVIYHYCGETLRDEFYLHKWKYEECEPHSIFVSQAGYPIKGLHILLKAMPLILRRYPDAKIYVAGRDISRVPWYRTNSYGKYIKDLIRGYGFGGKIEFTGSLDERQMCRQYLKCNLFVCCSAIENSPNSLGEAQLLGMPHVASFVGGIPEIVNHNNEVLYRFEEYEMLAQRVCDIFAKGSNAQGAAFDRQRYDGEKNIRDLISIYKCLSSNQ